MTTLFLVQRFSSHDSDARDPVCTGSDDENTAALVQVDAPADIASDPVVHAEDGDDPVETGPQVQEVSVDEQLVEASGTQMIVAIRTVNEWLTCRRLTTTDQTERDICYGAEQEVPETQ